MLSRRLCQVQAFPVSSQKAPPFSFSGPFEPLYVNSLHFILSSISFFLKRENYRQCFHRYPQHEEHFSPPHLRVTTGKFYLPAKAPAVAYQLVPAFFPARLQIWLALIMPYSNEESLLLIQGRESSICCQSFPAPTIFSMQILPAGVFSPRGLIFFRSMCTPSSGTLRKTGSYDGLHIFQTSNHYARRFQPPVSANLSLSYDRF
jgi:hypothetical protein